MPLHEQKLITGIRRSAVLRAGVVKGIGDDCAVLKIPAGHDALVTTDFTLEGVHFRREWHAPEVVGRRCLTRGLSDLAAMGGRPIAAFLSLAIPKTVLQRWVDGFMKGLLQLADQFDTTLAGGDTAESKSGILADIVVLGSVPRGKAVMRSGAKPGDGIYVSGELGGATAALEQLFRGKKVRPADYSRHFHPTPRVEIGEWLREKRIATAMIDLSDGLSTDLTHICEESGVGAKIEASPIPRAMVGRRHEPVPLELALHGGEDYELLFTAHKPVPERIAGLPIHRIGQVRSGSGIVLVGENGKQQRLKPGGWEHFRK